MSWLSYKERELQKIELNMQYNCSAHNKVKKKKKEI